MTSGDLKLDAAFQEWFSRSKFVPKESLEDYAFRAFVGGYYYAPAAPNTQEAWQPDDAFFDNMATRVAEKLIPIRITNVYNNAPTNKSKDSMP